MAIVLSSQENIDLLLTLVKVAIAIGVLAIAMGLLFWFRLRNLERHIYSSRKPLKPRFAYRNYRNHLKTPRTVMATTTSPRSRDKTTQLYPQKTQLYRPKTMIKPSKTALRHSGKSSWRWLVAISIASVTGIAIALLQFSNGFISLDLMPLIWLLIGLALVIGATLD